jgi:probable F420-dependent oxidoreductase
LKFGVNIGGLPGGVPGSADIVRFAATAEAVGFDSVHAGDHVQWHAPILEPTTVLATFAAATRRVRIASSVVLLPLRDPVLIAKTIAGLDAMSGGRIVFGVGLGGNYPEAYAAMRIPLAERGSRANESLEIVRGLFEHEAFSFTGRHYVIENAAILPRPVQRRLPIWVGGSSEGALRRAARYGDGWIAAWASERKLAGLLASLRKMLVAEGRSIEDFSLASFVFVYVDPDPKHALERAIREVAELYRMPGELVMDKFGAAGPVDACVDKVLALHRVGMQHVVFEPMCGYEEWPQQIEVYGEVITRVRQAIGS